jgi:hypothetical protein
VLPRLSASVAHLTTYRSVSLCVTLPRPYSSHGHFRG